MKKVLIVDDDANIGEIIMEYLKEVDNIETSFTPFSSKAITLLQEKHYDLLITDILMPEVNGIELTEFVFKNLPSTKVLACSGGGDSGSLVAGMALDQALEEGAHNALMKPFDKEELLTKVRDLLKG